MIGASLGGMKALQQVLAALPEDYRLPIVIVQHRGKGLDELAASLSPPGAMLVVEASDKQRLLPGRAYLAPADYHLLIEGDTLALTTEAPVNSSRPSIDVLFESAAHQLGDAVVAVLLTGASHDGARGAASIRARGGLVLVQDPASAEAPTMPLSAIQAGAADRVLSLEQVGATLNELAGAPTASSPKSVGQGGT